MCKSINVPLNLGMLKVFFIRFSLFKGSNKKVEGMPSRLVKGPLKTSALVAIYYSDINLAHLSLPRCHTCLHFAGVKGASEENSDLERN